MTTGDRTLRELEEDELVRLPALQLPKKKKHPQKRERSVYAFSNWLKLQATLESSPSWTCGIEASLIRGKQDETSLIDELRKTLDARIVRDAFAAFEKEYPR
jgi:hypothetical protein